MSKVDGAPSTSIAPVGGEDIALESYNPRKDGTAADMRDMRRMGKHQELQVGIRLPWHRQLE